MDRNRAVMKVAPQINIVSTVIKVVPHITSKRAVMKVAPQINQVRSSKYGHVLEYGSHQESTTQGSRDRLLVRAPDS